MVEGNCEGESLEVKWCTGNGGGKVGGGSMVEGSGERKIVEGQNGEGGNGRDETMEGEMV